MSPLDALMPNTGTILRHLTRAAASTPKGLPHSAQGCAPGATLGKASALPANPERVASIGPDFRKYIVFANADGHEFAVVFPRKLLHIDIELAADCGGQARYVPISAGSYIVALGQVILSGIGSTTLDLLSRPQDAALIQQLLSESA